MEYSNYGDHDPSQMVNTSCDFVDPENLVCRYVEAGLKPGGYKDSICSVCLVGLEQLRGQRGEPV